MSEEYRAKVFKSGNSLALRLPKALGFQEGAEMLLREEQGRYVVEPAERPKRKINLDGLAGSMPGLRPFEPEEREFEEPPRIWDDADWPGWKAIR
ncbi:AbrB/MazE/SpoVT family DNA-binding domain-containing protein [Sphingomonas sp.]|uniref:AbrB/MazE/SpoVT family DNA-binding domain-containing protein n=1 Tax=Sphingomonas sp. TaxID=28214 RepID=UPI000DB42F82|nr:AbrB/MazE/SpoVT family DNA-binding domain-containing protein [Sphingomonas sp.]PZU11665.1 MAG: AbrB/MazE/SpoVT family DNA-binding domain-containing protein [Sphingomonas sp.]